MTVEGPQGPAPEKDTAPARKNPPTWAELRDIILELDARLKKLETRAPREGEASHVDY